MRRRYMMDKMSGLNNNNTIIPLVVFGSFGDVGLCRIATPTQPSGSTGNIISLFKGYEVIDYYQKDYGDNAPLMNTELVSRNSVLYFRYSNPGKYLYGEGIYLYKIQLVDRSFFIIHSWNAYNKPYVFSFLNDRGLLNVCQDSGPICIFEDSLIG